APYAVAAPAGVLDANRAAGQSVFQQRWIPGGEATETDEDDGLGPLYNATSCASCHSGPALSGLMVLDAKGDGASALGLVARVGDAKGGPDPRYGYQIQTDAVSGVRSEGSIGIRYDSGSARPQLQLHLAQGPLSAGFAAAPLLAPPLVGHAAIDQVDVAT